MKNTKHDLEKTGQYYKYLGKFYFEFGQWDKSIESLKKAMDIYEEYNDREYLMSKSKALIVENFKSSSYDRASIEEIRFEMRKEALDLHRRMILLYLTVSLYLKKEHKYALDILKEDKELGKDYPFEILDDTNKILSYAMSTEDNSNEFIFLLGKSMAKQRHPNVNILFSSLLGFKFFEDGNHYQSLNYLLDTMELSYAVIKKIPDRKLQISFIKRIGGDYIKQNIVENIYKIFDHRLEYISIDDLYPKDAIEKYFDYSSLYRLIENENLVNKIGPYYDDEDIRNIYDLGTLILNLTNDHEYNIKLILKYLLKEILAQKGYVLLYDDENNRYHPIINLNNELERLPNENLLALANRSERGVLINNNLGANTRSLYKGLLPEDAKALLCVPIMESKSNSFSKKEKRSKGP